MSKQDKWLLTGLVMSPIMLVLLLLAVSGLVSDNVPAYFSMFYAGLAVGMLLY